MRVRKHESILCKACPWLAVALLPLAFCAANGRAQAVGAHPAVPATIEQRVEQLTAAVSQAQAQMELYRRQLIELRGQLAALKEQLAAGADNSVPAARQAAAAEDSVTSSSLDEIRERQAIEESQIATHEFSKVETDSKYPLRLGGLVLFNGFVNTRQVDNAASPAYAVSGAGSTGLSLRQTVLGLDARGPHLFTAASHADLRVDFFASDVQSDYAAGGVVRLRTAHASMDWKRTQAFVELDRSILNPNEPSSLVAVAQPLLAWSGNLWTWNPQAGVSRRFPLSDSSRLVAQAAWIDTSDPQPLGSTAAVSAVTQAERSRWPGTEGRIAFAHGDSRTGTEIGLGGYFSPHTDGYGDRFNAWAATADVRLPLSRYFELTANAYRGQALAGLGGGGYVNYFYRYIGSAEMVRALDDVGGWAQLKAKASQRLEFNAGFGTDNPFAGEIRSAILPSGIGTAYSGLARNRSFYANAIYSPSAYLLFSLEYRRLLTDLSTGPTTSSDVIGIGAGYRF